MPGPLKRVIMAGLLAGALLSSALHNHPRGADGISSDGICAVCVWMRQGGLALGSFQGFTVGLKMVFSGILNIPTDFQRFLPSLFFSSRAPPFFFI